MSVNFTRYETAMHDLKIKLAQTIRERDEARRELEELDFLRYEGGEESIGREIEKAEARGYRRGVQDAAARLDKFGYSEFRDAILALLEQTGDTNSPHLESSAGNSPKR